MAGPLTGKGALITGGGSGIGRAACERLAAQGCTVGVADIDADAAQEVAAHIGETGAHALALPLDVTDSGSCGAAVEAFARHAGRLDILFPSAGIQVQGTTVEETSDALWHRFIQTNLTGSFYMCRASIPHMREAGGGTIVLIASGRVITGAPRQAAYAASKGGIASFTRSLAVEVGGDGITVNCLVPGVVDTAGSRRWTREVAGRDPEEMVAEWASRDPLGAVTTPDDVASFVVYLATDGHFITGNMHTLRVYTT